MQLTDDKIILDSRKQELRAHRLYNLAGLHTLPSTRPKSLNGTFANIWIPESVGMHVYSALAFLIRLLPVNWLIQSFMNMQKQKMEQNSCVDANITEEYKLEYQDIWDVISWQHYGTNISIMLQSFRSEGERSNPCNRSIVGFVVRRREVRPMHPQSCRYLHVKKRYPRVHAFIIKLNKLIDSMG